MHDKKDSTKQRLEHMKDEEFVDWLGNKTSLQISDIKRIQQRINSLQGYFYEQAQRLLLRLHHTGEEQSTGQHIFNGS